MTSAPCLSHSSFQSSIPNPNTKPNIIPIFQWTDSLSDLIISTFFNMAAKRRDENGAESDQPFCSSHWTSSKQKDEMTEKTRAQSVMDDFHRHIWLGLCTACELWERPFQLIHAKSWWVSGRGQDGRHSCLSQQLVSWFFLNHTWLYAKSGEGPIKTGIKISANFC